ncbi:hypothetical protein [Nocardioides pocheonensis]|jgi:hypothetical protein|uniref:Uncharacterized protein n=1 Tax=Nocardioides pocheonensis TaxID=661485 RepID=A0A3N0GYK7_9ACTN|nr:hypothetical protein [Nocardioides pocheonensis]RNM17557.1 hypothetical protein EFL26_01905 [Nocardioides pocheonensis]
MAAAGALLVSSGLALMAAPSPAAAGDTRAAESTCTPSEAYTETSDWVLTSPGTDWYEVDQRQVLVTPAVDPTYGPGQRYSWNPQGPYDESVVPPAWPTPAQGRWTPNTAAYNPGHVGEPVGVVFQQGHGNGGDNASWFYWERVQVTPGSDAVYRTEYKFALDHPAVTCPVEAYADVQWIEPSCGTKADFKTKSGDPVDVTWSAPSATPAPGVTVTLVATAMDGYTFGGSATQAFTHTYAAVVPPAGQTYDPVTGVCAAPVPPVVEPPTTPQVSPPKTPVKAHVKAQTKTPTVVHAGLVTTASDTGAQAGLGLVLAGLVLLAGAGSLVLAGGGEPKDAA